MLKIRQEIIFFSILTFKQVSLILTLLSFLSIELVLTNLMTFLIMNYQMKIFIIHLIPILIHFVTTLKQKVFHHVHAHEYYLKIFSIFSVYVILIFPFFILLIFEVLSSKLSITFSSFIRIFLTQLQFMSLKNFMKQVTSNLLLFYQLMQIKMTLF